MSLAQGNNTPTRPRIEPGSPDPESDALTTRPVRPPPSIYDFMEKLPSISHNYCQMSHIMRKPHFLHMPKKGRISAFVFAVRYIDCTIPLLPKSGISSLWPSSVIVQPGLCCTWSETQKTGFLVRWLKYHEICTLNKFFRKVYFLTRHWSDYFHWNSGCKVDLLSLLVNFFLFFKIKFCCIDMTMCDLVHAVETTSASLWENRSSEFPTRSDTNLAAQSLNMARDLRLSDLGSRGIVLFV